MVLQLRQEIIGNSPSLLATLKQVAKASQHPSSRILLLGESGTGKEILARAIHKLGPRSSKPWIAINISGIPAALLESALFGHERGAFTGATDRHVGLFEEAGDGTIFLDEIGDLEISLQTKLLRVIQEKNFRRLKGKQTLLFEARLVCATNKDLAAAVNEGAFRRDLFHRIAEVTIQVPSLRERKGDVDLLLNHFLDLYRGNRVIRFARETLTILRSYPFWGNVRELDNLVKSALIECDGKVILPQHLPLQSMGTLLSLSHETAQHNGSSQSTQRGGVELQSLIKELNRSLTKGWMELPYREARWQYVRAFDRVYLKDKLEKWRYNVTQAAKEAGVDVKTFRNRWKESGFAALEQERERSDEYSTQDTNRGKEREEI
jgi:DNA-binding NtrC family response regulator